MNNVKMNEIKKTIYLITSKIIIGNKFNKEVKDFYTENIINKVVLPQ